MKRLLTGLTAFVIIAHLSMGGRCLSFNANYHCAITSSTTYWGTMGACLSASKRLKEAGWVVSVLCAGGGVN
jgi:hypothetical protein